MICINQTRMWDTLLRKTHVRRLIRDARKLSPRHLQPGCTPLAIPHAGGLSETSCNHQRTA